MYTKDLKVKKKYIQIHMCMYDKINLKKKKNP